MRSFALTALAAALVAAHTPAIAQPAEAQARIAEAQSLFERAERRGEVGDRRGRITLHRQGLAKVDEAIALGADGADIRFGREEMGLQLGELLLEAERPAEARDAFVDVAAKALGSLAQDAVPDDRQERLHLARARRGQIFAELAAGDLAGARASMRHLITVGLAMQAAEPANTYLTRRLALDLEGEAFFRWVTQDEEGARETALETLALFRAVAEANPGSDEEMRNHFRWAFVAAALHRDDPALWAEALAVGRALEQRGALQAADEEYLRAVRLNAGE